MNQYGFFFDQSRCSGCQTCSVACKSANELPPGPLKYLRIYQYEEGAFPEVRIRVQWIPCYHCEKPSCVAACPTGAVEKESNYGAVLIHPENCTGCRHCYWACPYGAPVFADDSPTALAEKCDMCIDRLEQEGSPVCARSCPMRALDFGPLEDLEKRYEPLRDLPDLPPSGSTRPAVLFKPAQEKRRLVPYDPQRALELLMMREPLPQIYGSPEEVTEIPPHLVGRDSLTIKHGSAAELLRATRNDDG